MSTDIQLAPSPTARAQVTTEIEQPMATIEGLSLWYGAKRALREISMSVPRYRITAYIGPSGGGKMTLLRCLNRMNDLVDGVRSRTHLDPIVERSLRSAALWDEVLDRLPDSALSLSGGQQQRLCIARALAVEPEVLLMDEPCSALAPIATARIEELMLDLKRRYTIIIVTHNMQQAARVSDDTGFMLMGELVEFGVTKELFTNPRDRRTEEYITGRFG